MTQISEEERKKIHDEIMDIIYNVDLTPQEKRRILNEMESRHKQDVFIKTNICSMCNAIDIEVWLKFNEYQG